MSYEFRVTELAGEFKVHRNTIRNWINSGLLPAKKTAGRRYRVEKADYTRLCEKFGRKPQQHIASEPCSDTMRATPAGPSPTPFTLQPSAHPLYTNPALADICVGCGSCAGACPISGVDAMDPRKLVRMAILGMDKELTTLDWPWKCTLCGRCRQVCPVGVEIVELIRTLRSTRKRTLVPGSIQLGVTTCLEQGNNIGIPKDDFLQILLQQEEETKKYTGPDFCVPVDSRGARLLVPVNSKIPFAEPESLQWWWRIFYAAGESWTIPADNWEAVNWGFFSGDDDAARTMVGRIVDNLERLSCRALLLPECGHAAHAVVSGLQRWFPEALKQYTIYTSLDLLSEYIDTKRIHINRGLCYDLTTYHDPCHYSRNDWITPDRDTAEQGRKITGICCPNFIEMIPNRRFGYCCGGGGGTMATPFDTERIFHGRIKARQIRESGAKVVVTPCPTCRDQLQAVLNREFELDIRVRFPWQLISEALVAMEQQSGT